MLKENEKLVTESFHSELLGDEDLIKGHGLQPGDVGKDVKKVTLYNHVGKDHTSYS